MHDFLKKLFGKKDPEVIVISFNAIPAWLDERDEKALTVLLSKSGEPKKNIREAIAVLENIINGIARAEQDPEIHPKLKSIAKKSLPLFVKAMHSSITRELPDDIEEFYPAAVECLKGCLSSIRGQGRYLQIAFPEEMKSIKRRIDTIGNEINLLTAALSEFRKDKNLIETARTVHNALIDIDADLRKAVEKDQRIAVRIADITKRTETIKNELAALSSDMRMAEVTGLTEELRILESEREALARTYAAHSMTVSHVLRKAEKIAVKQNNPSEISVLRRAISFLSDHDVPDAKKLTDSLAASCHITEKLISTGEISLKNKEERAIFSDIREFSSTIGACCTALVSNEQSCQNVRERIDRHSLLAKKKSLEREKNQLETMLAKEENARSQLEDWRATTSLRVPELKEDLKKKMECMLGEDVQLQIEDRQMT